VPTETYEIEPGLGMAQYSQIHPNTNIHLQPLMCLNLQVTDLDNRQLFTRPNYEELRVASKSQLGSRLIG
jgi:hypothetical protein